MPLVNTSVDHTYSPFMCRTAAQPALQILWREVQSAQCQGSVPSPYECATKHALRTLILSIMPSTAVATSPTEKTGLHVSNEASTSKRLPAQLPDVGDNTSPGLAIIADVDQD
jgi:hypothetical protein